MKKQLHIDKNMYIFKVRIEPNQEKKGHKKGKINRFLSRAPLPYEKSCRTTGSNLVSTT
jgi:hypothetical protein